MKSFWENDSEPLESGEHAGEFAATVDLEDGSPVHRYYGKTHKDVADKLLVAQVNASSRIKQLRDQVNAQPPEPAVVPRGNARKPLTADERMAVAADLEDPAKAPEAIKRVLAAEGVPVEKLRERLATEEEDRMAQSAAEEAQAFAQNTPEWYPTEHNKDVLRQYIVLQSWAWTRNNFARAFEILTSKGLLQVRPTEEPAPTPGAQPATGADGARTRPRGMTSTGLRSADASGAPSGHGTAKPKYTRRDIDAMSTAVFDDKLAHEPGFREFIENLPQAAAAR